LTRGEFELAMKSGAIDFLTKPFRELSLLDAVNAGIERDRTRRQEVKLISAQQRFQLLTPREREVFALVVAGRPNQQIATEIGLDESTVKVHRSKIIKKMRATSIVDLARIADRLGLSAGISAWWQTFQVAVAGEPARRKHRQDRLSSR
jgi:FixJ family two-component response regulator